MEGCSEWQGTGFENRRPQGLEGSSPSPSAKIEYTMKSLALRFDSLVINRLQKLEIPLARTAIFIVYFWFGLLKLLDMSSAGPLVQTFFEKTIWFMPFQTFYFLFRSEE